MKFGFRELLHLLRRVVHVFLVPTYVDEWTNPAVADVDYFVEATATAASIVTHSPAVADLSPPRPLTFVASNHADFNAVAMVITGTVKTADGSGVVAATETLTLTNDGNTTDTSLNCWVNVTSIVIPAQAGTGGSYTIGFGAAIGLSKKAKTRAGKPFVIAQSAAGTVLASNGTFTAAATALPNGSYSPNSAPDGSRDYALMYELDPDAF